jgi:hypothetical protein
MPRTKLDTDIHIKIDMALYRRVLEMARSEQRTLASMIRFVLNKYVTEKAANQ